MIGWLTARRGRLTVAAVFYALVGWAALAGETESLFRALTFLAATLAWVFVIRYGFWSPWRRTVVGRSLMYVWLSLTAVLTLIVLSYWFGAYPARDWVRTGVYSTLPLAFLSFVSVLVQQQTKRDAGEVPDNVDTDL